VQAIEVRFFCVSQIDITKTAPHRDGEVADQRLSHAAEPSGKTRGGAAGKAIGEDKIEASLAEEPRANGSLGHVESKTEKYHAGR
jgi:hypothetical protein